MPVVGAVLLLYFTASHFLDRQVRGYAETEGTIVSTEVVMDHGGRYRDSHYEILLTYTYEVDGREYTSSRYRSGLLLAGQGYGRFETRSDAESVATRWPEGTKIPVFFNPDRPSKAVLTKEPNDVPTAGWFLAAALLAIGLGWVAREKLARSGADG